MPGKSGKADFPVTVGVAFRRVNVPSGDISGNRRRVGEKSWGLLGEQSVWEV